MSFQKFKTNSYCVGQKQYSVTKNITGEVTVNKKTGKEILIILFKQKFLEISSKNWERFLVKQLKN